MAEKQMYWRLFIALLLSALPPLMLAQQEQTPRPPAAKGNRTAQFLRLKPRFPLNVRKHYHLVHSTTVTRVYNDSSTAVFKTRVEYFLSLRAIEDREDGFVTVSVNIDSLRYFYQDPEIQIQYNSQVDFPPPIENWQFLWTTIPYGREWFFTYSPYGEVALIESPARELLYQQVFDSTSTLDTVQRFLWQTAICDQRLLFLSDITRNILPQSLVTWNDEWFRSVLFEADKMLFGGTASVQVTRSENPDEYWITATADSLHLIFPKVLTPAYEDHFNQAHLLSGYQTHAVFLNPYGTIREADGKLEARVRIRTLRGKTFTHIIHSTYRLELKGQYKW